MEKDIGFLKKCGAALLAPFIWFIFAATLLVISLGFLLLGKVNMHTNLRRRHA
jgi:hypothetical protein